MEAHVFELSTPVLTGGRSHMPLSRTDLVSVGLNYYTPGRKNTLHTHPGEDHAFVVLEGEATFYDKSEKATVLKKGQGIMLPEGWYYRFENSGDKALVLLRFSARKAKPAVTRIDSAGRTRSEDSTEFVHVDGDTVDGKFWQLA
ncbi:MAG TPA: cupin domain-containing protein [Candidatus Binatia bacterium]|jgi:oxalate decarboxylase/phosphoglucose isomerase-like protein (cupin superfamily)